MNSANNRHMDQHSLIPEAVIPDPTNDEATSTKEGTNPKEATTNKEATLTATVLVEKFGKAVQPHARTIIEIFKMHSEIGTPALKVQFVDHDLTTQVIVKGSPYIDTHALQRLGESSTAFDASCCNVVANFEDNTTTYNLCAVGSGTRRYQLEECSDVQPHRRSTDGLAVRQSTEFSNLGSYVAPRRIHRLVELYMASSKRIPQFSVCCEPATADHARVYVTNIRVCPAGLLYRLLQDPLLSTSRACVSLARTADGTDTTMGEITTWMALDDNPPPRRPPRNNSLWRRLMNKVGHH